MPSETFYRLPAEKRGRLIAAIEAELSQVPLSKMSINRIVKAAGIPRGSYYQYFNGTADLLSLIFGDFKACAAARAEQLWRESAGDFYALFDGMFAYVLEYGLSAPRRKLFCNLFSEIRIGDVFSAFEGYPNALRTLSEQLGERATVFEIMMAVFKESIAAVFAHPECAEELSARFREKIKLVSAL